MKNSYEISTTRERAKKVLFIFNNYLGALGLFDGLFHIVILYTLDSNKSLTLKNSVVLNIFNIVITRPKFTFTFF